MKYVLKWLIQGLWGCVVMLCSLVLQYLKACKGLATSIIYAIAYNGTGLLFATFTKLC